MTRDRTEKIDDDAIAWCLRLHEAPLSPEDQQAFSAWLAADPVHSERFERARGMWSGLDDLALAPELLALRRQALGAVQLAGARRWSVRHVPMIGWMAAAAVVLLVVGLAVMLHAPSRYYETGIGERRTVILADGSTMMLDADTGVRVRFTEDRRELTLDHGRASFKVAKNPLRPFAVTSGKSMVVAVGTAFSIERLSDQVRVALYEGRVAVLRNAAEGPAPQFATVRGTRETAEQALTPGQELIVSTDTPLATLRNAAVSDRLEGGQLSFADEPLLIAVQRVNRYNIGKPIVVTPEASDIRISGVFNAGDIDAFLQGVVAAFPVRAVPSRGSILLAPRGGTDITNFEPRNLVPAT
ncbi:FecR domain-containing protein [uncultured Sphingomonas sp.]|uniref:FecR family protein n=1 Tax=uncultured Sphingomonas sp. TaxID=158754 RepID=UPI0025FAA6B3|nr:FecR domain-containing protein [uncultured Sphingomonas sp.]